jgi:hypothetical protein
MGNAAAVALARTGVAASGPFQNRYIAYTLWFHVGLLALLGLMEGRFWHRARSVWITVLAAGYAVGFVEGIQDGRSDFARNQIIAASAILRHAAVEPVMLDGIDPGGGPSAIAKLDKLESLGLLHVPTLRSESVSDATVVTPPLAKGAFRSGEWTGGTLSLRGWAMESTSHDVADAIAISAQVAGQKEHWLGLAQRRLVESKLHEKHHSCAREKRLGWSYIHGHPDTGSENPLPLSPKPLPVGTVTFRAYALDVPSARFSLLPGEFTAEIK